MDEGVEFNISMIVKVGLFVSILLFFWIMIASPLLKPWWASQEGKAELAQAEQNRQIAILESKAKYESAINLAQADIERAKGVAEANHIIANSLTPEYLKYKFIDELKDSNTQVIYVPTEANLPILEARDKK